MAANDTLQDRAIHHSLLLAQYGRGLADQLVRLLNSADAEILTRIAGQLTAIEQRGIFLSSAAVERLQRLSEEIQAFQGALFERFAATLDQQMVDLAVGEAAFQQGALEGSLGIKWQSLLPSPTRLATIVRETPMEGRLLSSWVQDMSAARQARIDAALRLGMIQGETTDQLVQRIRGSKALNYQDGVLNISRRSAQTLARTATSHVSNVTAQETWRSNSQVVKGWQFLSTLDTRTSTTCAALDGSVHAIGEGPIPPRHPGCRSISVAVTKSWQEMGLRGKELSVSKRASMDGQVAGNTRFADWLAKRSTGDQDKLLGPTRAQLFRSGKLTLDQLIKQDGQVLTLAQLQSRYPDILG